MVKKRGENSPDVNFQLGEPPKYKEIEKIDLIDKISLAFIHLACLISIIKLKYLNLKNKSTETFNNILFQINQKLFAKILPINDYLLIKTKKAAFKRTIYLIFFAFITYFLFFSALPGNEDIMCSVFAVNDCGVTSMGNGDLSISACTAYGGCNSGPQWNIGGEVDGTACCGDDIATIGSTANYVITESSSTDAPAGYNDAILACCSTGTDCNYNDACVDSGSASAAAIPSKAYCASSVWYGGDYSNAACTAVVGSGNWAIGGETAAAACCGDDSNEYTKTCTDSSANGACGADTTACCSSNTDCIDDTGTCRDTGACYTFSGTQKSYCNSNSWEDPDENSAYCIASGCGFSWNLGGDIVTCCGDDSTDNIITESSSTDAPTGYNDGITACCDASTDCNYNDVCTATGSSSSALVPDKAYCSSGTWYGGDYSEAACISIAGANKWNIGGEIDSTTCCTDDNGQYVNTRLVDEAVMDDYADNTSDNACCLSTTDCVHASTCYDDQDTSKDADGNGDTDYCDLGTWKDCLDISDCPSNKVCSPIYFDCVDPDGFIYINNLGVTGIDTVNQEYTSSRSVALLLGFSENATACRYTNYPNISNIPNENYAGWTAWEPCISNRFWVLSNGTGLKHVFYHINFSDARVENYFNDSIFYNFTGSGLDTTPPGKAIVYHDNYTNDANNAIIRWYNATDRESLIFGIPLKYEVKLFNSTGYVFGTITTTATMYNFSFASRPHGSSLYANVTVINSANMKSNSTSGALVIDLISPLIDANGSVYNFSNLNYQEISLADSWFYSNKAYLSWNASDANSGISEYSYILSQDNSRRPDDIGESAEYSKLYNNLKSGRYYFFVKAKDKAGNWGSHKSVNFSIDNTAPTRSQVLTETPINGGVKFTWSESTDSESGILLYRINLTTSEGVFLQSFNQTDISNRSHSFALLNSGDVNATIGAMNGAGIWMWSNGESSEVDITEPEIFLSQNVVIATNYPIIKAWTNEQATCLYNGSEFIYTNATYHESKLRYHANSDYSYLITCTDNFGNFVNALLNLTIDGTSIGNTLESTSSQVSAYEKLIATFQFSLKDTADLISGWDRNSFDVKLNGNLHLFDIFDNGNGYYNLSILMPKAGIYSLTIETEYDSLELNLTSKELNAVTKYNDGSIVALPENKKHITFYSTNTAIGLANDEENSDIRSYGTASGLLNISSDAKNSIYIINTKSQSLFSDRDNRLDKANFIDLINPSFGYAISEDYIIAYTLSYNDFILSARYSSLKQGTHKLRISMSGPNEMLIRPGSGDSQNVITG